MSHFSQANLKPMVMGRAVSHLNRDPTRPFDAIKFTQTAIDAGRTKAAATMRSITPTAKMSCRPQATCLARPTSTTVLLTVAFGCVWAFSLSRSLFDPIGYDQALYQYMTDRVIAGERLYVDVWDQNAPGIIAVHWLSTLLVGHSPIALRVFDAGWQCLTMVALIALAGRDGRQWSVGWLAATLYALAYYGMGYIHTAQREGFLVLPLLLAIHAVMPTNSGRVRAWIPLLTHAFAGIMCFAAFAIKPPMGLCFGFLWIQAVIHAWHERYQGWRAFTAVVGLTVGFISSVTATVTLLAHWGSWAGCWRVLTRADIPGYISGPDLLREIIPHLAVGFIALALILALTARLRDRERSLSTPHTNSSYDWLRKSFPAWAAGAATFALLTTNHHWPGWRTGNVPLIGLWLPAFGSVLLCFWSGRSAIWRSNLLLLLASWTAIALQGKFFLYHYPPLFAFVAYLSAHELIRCFRQWDIRSRPATVWAMVCLAATAYLAIDYWWPKMTRQSYAPYVLTSTTLEDHYTQITRHKKRLPNYATTQKVAQRVQALTTENDPIGVLFHETRLYYFSQRPPVHYLIGPHMAYKPLFADFIRTIHEKKPKVLLAQIPRSARQTTDRPKLQSAVFESLEDYFGPLAQVIRKDYSITEVIDDVCILQPMRQSTRDIRSQN